MVIALRIFRMLTSVIALACGLLVLWSIGWQSLAGGLLEIYGGFLFWLFVIAPGVFCSILGTLTHYELCSKPRRHREHKGMFILIITAWATLILASCILPFCQSAGTC